MESTSNEESILKVGSKQKTDYLFFFFFKEIGVYLVIYLFVFGCVGSLFLCEGFL